MYSRCEEVEAAFSQHNLATSVSLWTMDCGLWTCIQGVAEKVSGIGMTSYPGTMEHPQ